MVKTSTNLNSDPVNMLLHCLRLGISTGIYGLVLTNLINDVLDLSKIEAEQMVIVSQPTEIEPLLREIMTVFQYKVQ